MNYSSCNNYAVQIRKLGFDFNGNQIKRLTFYKKINGVMRPYKTTTVNESLDNVTADRIIKLWG